MFYKKMFLLLSIILFTQITFNSTKSQCFNICIPNNDEFVKNKLTENFKPDFHINKQTDQDIKVLNEMKELFVEPDPIQAKKLKQKDNIKCYSEREVYNKAIDKYNAQEVIVRTKDDFRLSALYFKNPNAILNIIYITGYFNDQTPSGKWATPFWPMHKAELNDSLSIPTNMLVFDWRSFGFSEGKKSIFSRYDFGANAYLDIQAVIDFIKKDNKNPIILVGFCAGAAMAMKATIEAQKKGNSTADGLVLNSIFSKFENQFNRACIAEDRLLRKIIMKFPIARWYLDLKLNGSIFDLNPIEMIEDIKIPCYFEHFTYDPFAVLEEAIEVYQKAKEKNIFTKFMLSDIGNHVRIHSKAPFQYRESLYNFLKESGIIKNYNCS
ncbi:alpha/beta fold hydrolase [Candidatus Dependentiae bacterium]|nr:alpha/beta fold hydrolase [Candidatus Dependentiae bacterium]